MYIPDPQMLDNAERVIDAEPRRETVAESFERQVREGREARPSRC